MNEVFQKRSNTFQSRLVEVGVDTGLIFDTDNIYYLSAYWGYLGIQFGRPTLLVIPNEGDCSIITPSLEAEMARKMTWIEDVQEWSDGVDGEWRACLDNIFRNKKNMKIGIEKDKTHPVITEFLKKAYPDIMVVSGEQK
mgnify:CR=1 FL=1